jgi:hypothetical protein
MVNDPLGERPSTAAESGPPRFRASLAGAGLLALKSWREPVRVVLWSCQTHAGDVRFPDMVIHDNELHLFVPTVSLAEATTAELMTRRRQGRRYAEDATSGAAAVQSDTARPTRAPAREDPAPAPPSVTRPLREKLPPIKLDE